MKIIEELKKHPANSKLAMMIRHADRDPIPDGDMGDKIPINDLGKKNAIVFGEKLRGQPLARIFSSPIYRCIQTAEHIAIGYNKSLEIITTKSLGGPGIHVHDEVAATEFHLKYGFHELYRKFMQNELIPGVTNSKTYGTAMTGFLKQNTAENGITLFVTHDSMIALYDFCLSGRVYNQQNWINYLSGLILKY